MSFEWKSHPLHSVGRIVTGKTPSSNIEGAFDDQGIPFITPSDMDGRRCIDSTVRYLSEVGLEVSKKYLVPEGSVAVSCIGSDMGKAVLVGQDSVTNQQINTIIVDESQFNPVFVYYVLSTMQQELKNIASGSATPILNKTHFGNVEIRAPKRELQDKIVSILEPSDLKITLNTQTNQTLEQMAQALFKSWFVDFDPVIDNALDSGFFEREFEGEGIPEPLAKRVAIRQALREAAGADTDASAIGRLPPETRALFPDSFEEHPELSWIPKGWEASRLDSVLELAYGKALKKTDRIDGSISVYGSGGIGGYHNEALVSGPGIIVGRKGTVGSLFWEDDDFFPIDTVFYVKPHAGVPLGYCFELLKTLRLEGMNTDAAVPGLNRNNAYRLLFAKPSTDIKNLFANFINSLKAQQKSLHDQTKSLAAMRDTLLPKLLSGELTLATTESVESPISA
ncbi:restriction endonuclease subunit S [Shewanella algae]|uniref:restriction endonuclease subunit S n=1 Tax=Shewanella algae TaxID=38313 RepID=UPI0005CDB5AF|nr:restriction endonuclease subunit S [Shewanella algae]